MSKIGKRPIHIPEGVAVEFADKEVVVRGPKGEIRVPVLLGVEISVEGKEIHCGIQGARKQIR
ncbi:MAG: 50S ribosomal protein L6, partial [Patescibacteria group bacterium]